MHKRLRALRNPWACACNGAMADHGATHTLVLGRPPGGCALVLLDGGAHGTINESDAALEQLLQLIEGLRLGERVHPQLRIQPKDLRS